MSVKSRRFAVGQRAVQIMPAKLDSKGSAMPVSSASAENVSAPMKYLKRL